jgi:aryl-alcohol dehydrogenase-like predicted oxidoreductase
MGFSLKQLSLSFLVSQSCFDFFLVGAESSEQVQDIIDTELVDSVNFDALSIRWGAYMSRKWMDPRQWTYTAG